MMSTLTSRNNDKYKYCPKYDVFLSQMRKELKDRLTNHTNERLKKIKSAVDKTIQEILSKGYTTNIDIGPYNQSFVNITEINALIDEWQGPIISPKYKAAFNKGEKGEIDIKKFSKDAINWLDQSSYKVTGPFFFTPHLKAVKSYLISFCDSINMEQHQNPNIDKPSLIIYSCIYFAVELLNTKIKFHRSKQQPLIRHKTLVNCKKLHAAFYQLYHELDLEEFKKTVKRNQKAVKDAEKKKEKEQQSTSDESGKKKKGKGSKYRLNAASFYDNFTVLCERLLNQEKRIKFGINIPLDSDHGGKSDNMSNILPAYFQDAPIESPARMDVDTPDSDTMSNSSMSSPGSIPPPVATTTNNQPPKPGLPVPDNNGISPPLRPPLPLPEAHTFAFPKHESENEQQHQHQPHAPPQQMQFNHNHNHGYQVPHTCLCEDDYIPVPIQIGSHTVQAIPSKQQNVVLVPMHIAPNGQGQFIRHPFLQQPVSTIPLSFPVQPPTLPLPVTFQPHPSGYNGNRGGRHYGSAITARHAPYIPPPNATQQQPPSVTRIDPQLPRFARYEPQPHPQYQQPQISPGYDMEPLPPQSPTHSVHSVHSSHSSHSSRSSYTHSASSSEYSQHDVMHNHHSLPPSVQTGTELPQQNPVERRPFMRESSITAPIQSIPLPNISGNYYYS